MDIDEPITGSIVQDEGADDDWEEDQPYQPALASTSTLPPPFPSSTFASSTVQADKEWSTMREKYTNDGFREGITSGKLSTLQSGFDSGYSLSSLPSRKLGNLRGQASSLLALLLLPPPPPSQPTTNTRPSPLSNLSTASSSNLSFSASERTLLIEDTRSLIRDLSRIKMLDVVGRDLEADEHTRTHGEGGEGSAEWQEGGVKEMDELEELMEGMTGNKEKKVGGRGLGLGERGEDGRLGLEVGGVVEGRLRELMRRAQVGGGKEEEEEEREVEM